VSTVWASISVSYALVVGSNRDGTKTPVRRACIGSIASPWHYEAAAEQTLLPSKPRRPANLCGLCRRWLVNRRQSGQHIDGLCQFRHSPSVKEVRWHGSSRSDVEAFPADARREAGYQLFQVQIGEAPSDWKPMTSIGPGVREIRIRQASGAYRIIYLATIGDAVHVLHAFQKKTQATAKRDIDLARARLRQIR
jgi:phage-related protein